MLGAVRGAHDHARRFCEKHAEAAAALSEALAWLARSPAKSDVAWETYSSCERVVNLCVLLAAFPDLLAEADIPVVTVFLRESVIWIDRHLEYYGLDHTNNHIFNNVRALVVAGAVLGDPATVERGLAVFARLGPLLFDAQGFLRERSSHYQFVVTNWLADAAHFATLLGSLATQVLPLQGLAEQAAQACAALLGCSGVHIGDISPDLHPALSLARLQALYPLPIATLSDEDLLASGWLRHADKANQLLSCLPARPYPESYASHGHADLGSFIWRHTGRIVLADPGRASYAELDQTLASAHNTLCVNGQPPLAGSVLRGGRWLPLPYTRTRIEAALQADGFTLSHDGVRRIAGARQHQRSVTVHNGVLTVVDTVNGSGQVALDWAWHLGPDWQATDVPARYCADDMQLSVQ